jgi:predicted RNase H-like HicB family nuclease
LVDTIPNWKQKGKYGKQPKWNETQSDFHFSEWLDYNSIDRCNIRTYNVVNPVGAGGKIMGDAQTSGYIVLTCEFYQEGRRWVALCDELGTSTFGRSLPAAERKLDEAIMLHLNTLENVGESERFFKEHNITFHVHKPKDFSICVNSLTRNDVYFRPCIQPVGELSAV